MRLSENEIRVIRMLASEIFGEQTIVRLFGSRVDDLKRGGDIDLFLQSTDESSPRAILYKKAEFLTRLEQCIGEQKIDLIILTERNSDLPIIQSAMKEGIVL